VGNRVGQIHIFRYGGTSAPSGDSSTEVKIPPHRPPKPGSGAMTAGFTCTEPGTALPPSSIVKLREPRDRLPLLALKKGTANSPWRFPGSQSPVWLPGLFLRPSGSRPAALMAAKGGTRVATELSTQNQTGGWYEHYRKFFPHRIGPTCHVGIRGTFTDSWALK
jgi:hypothetical protein